MTTKPEQPDEPLTYVCGIPIYLNGVDSEVDPENVRLGKWANEREGAEELK